MRIVKTIVVAASIAALGSLATSSPAADPWSITYDIATGNPADWRVVDSPDVPNESATTLDRDW